MTVGGQRHLCFSGSIPGCSNVFPFIFPIIVSSFLDIPGDFTNGGTTWRLWSSEPRTCVLVWKHTFVPCFQLDGLCVSQHVIEGNHNVRGEDVRVRPKGRSQNDVIMKGA